MVNYTEIKPKSYFQFRFDKYAISIGILILFHIVANIIWIYLNKVPPSWDAALHTGLSIKFFDYLKNNLFNFNLIDFLKISQYYPPFVHWIGVIFTWLGDGNYKIIELTGTLFFASAILFQYLYVNEIFKNKVLAFFSSFFLSFFITVYQQSRDHMLDIPLTVLLLGGLYFLHKSKDLTIKKYSILFFIFFSLAFLTKWYSIVYFSIPLLFSVIDILRDKKVNWALIRNIVIGIGIFVAVCIPWYIVNSQNILEISRVTATPELADPQRLLSLENIIFNLKLIIMFQTSLLGFLFFLFSLLLLFKNIKNKFVLQILLILIFNYLFFTFVPNKNIRYTIPLMPFFAMVIAYGVSHFLNKNRIIFTVISSFLIFYYIFSYFILSFGAPIYPKYKYAVNFPLIGWTDVYYLHFYPVRVIYQDNRFDYKSLIADIFKLKDGKVRLLLLVDTEQVNVRTLNPYLYKEFRSKKDDIYFINYTDLADRISEYEIDNFLTTGVNVVLVPQKYIGLPEAIREYDTLVRLQKYFLSGKAKNFILIKQYQLPGDEYHPGDTLLLYKKQAF